MYQVRQEIGEFIQFMDVISTFKFLIAVDKLVRGSYLNVKTIISVVIVLFIINDYMV